MSVHVDYTPVANLIKQADEKRAEGNRLIAEADELWKKAQHICGHTAVTKRSEKIEDEYGAGYGSLCIITCLVCRKVIDTKDT